MCVSTPIPYGRGSTWGGFVHCHHDCHWARVLYIRTQTAIGDVVHATRDPQKKKGGRLRGGRTRHAAACARARPARGAYGRRAHARGAQNDRADGTSLGRGHVVCVANDTPRQLCAPTMAPCPTSVAFSALSLLRLQYREQRADGRERQRAALSELSSD